MYMPDLPVMLRLAGRRVLIVGGGNVARRRVEAVLLCGAEVTVVAPQVDRAIERMDVTIEPRSYQPEDVRGMALVITAADDPQVNEAAARDAAAEGCLINRADSAEQGDLAIPAHRHIGPLTLAVHSGGISATAAALIRDELLDRLDADWLALLEAVAPLREEGRLAIDDTTVRQALFRRMTDADALALLKREGRAALIDHCRTLMEEARHEAGPTDAAD
jgi:precorrin-2 dehydrogenase/sirohydrochlorin ferrochelatase